MISVKRAARQEGSRYGLIKKLIDDGEIPAWQRGRRLLVRAEDVADALERTLRYVPPKVPRRRPRVTERPAIDPAIRF